MANDYLKRHYGGDKKSAIGADFLYSFSAVQQFATLWEFSAKDALKKENARRPLSLAAGVYRASRESVDAEYSVGAFEECKVSAIRRASGFSQRER